MAITEPNALPRNLDAQHTFDALVDWVHDEIIVKQHAPGLVVGVSGTDSILAFLVCYKAFEKAGHPERVAAIHYGDTMPDTNAALEKRLEEDPSALWFQRAVIPWLKEQAPQATIMVDDSIDHRRDGLRWGALMDWSVVANPHTGALRPRDQSYWVVGTRNATEEALMTYSNLSTAASLQPLTGLWKSEVLQLCEHLHVPETAIAKSCEMDCPCGRYELPAMNIHNVDALLQVRNGTLAPRYVEENIPADLRHELETFIETQIAQASFKKQIPYHANPQAVALATGVEADAIANAKHAIQNHPIDCGSITNVVPSIIKHGQANAACDLVCTPSPDRTAWLPEALTLLGTPHLRMQQKHLMLEQITQHPVELPMVNGLSKAFARMGNYGFAFPQWRFLTQHYAENPTLLEQFGMQHVPRANDVRDASLPASDPEHDEYGKGYVWQDAQWYVEYRRGYVLCSHYGTENPVTVVVRNNSYIFGRDRLPEPAYVSFAPTTPQALQQLDANSLTQQFQSLPAFVQQSAGKELRLNTARLNAGLDYLDHFNLNLNQWLRSDGPVHTAHAAGPDHTQPNATGGLSALRAFLAHKASLPTMGKRPNLYIGITENPTPPWQPLQSMPVTPETLANYTPPANSPITLMSGPDGDFPSSQASWQRLVQISSTLGHRFSK